VRAGLWAAVVLGCVSGLLALGRSGGSDGEGTTTTDDSADDLPAPVGNTAELAVLAWLTVEPDSDGLEDVFIDPPAVVDMATQNLRVGDVRAVAGQSLGDGYWTVTVAAQVEDVPPEEAADPEAEAEDAAEEVVAPPGPDAEDEEESGPVTWYVEVGVVGSVADGLAALTTPAVMAAPPPVSDEWRRSGVDGRTPERDDPIVDAIDGFLDAMLTGSGDPARYAAPGLEVTSLDPAPFDDVTVLEMALEDLDGGEVRAWAQAQVTTETGTRSVVGYEFVLVPRQDRWEVVEFWGTPSVVEGPAVEAPAAEGEGTDDTSSDDTEPSSDDTSSDDTSSDETTGDTDSTESEEDAEGGSSSDTTSSDLDADGDGVLSPDEMPAEEGATPE
jgi:hypothetical protein